MYCAMGGVKDAGAKLGRDSEVSSSQPWMGLACFSLVQERMGCSYSCCDS